MRRALAIFARMHAWVGRTVRFVSAATLVYACAGKSISNTEDDDNGAGGVGNTGYSGKGGGVSIGGKGGSSPGKGGTTGKGGSGKGGVAGTIGTGGKGGFGTGGSNVAGEPGFGGAGCGGRNVGTYSGICPESDMCISMLNPLPRYVRRNALAGGGTGPDDGGLGGEGGDSSGSGVSIVTAMLCGDDAGREGFLTFDYYMPDDRTTVPSFTLLSGSGICSYPLSIVAHGTLGGYETPPGGWWSTQCVRVTGDELASVVGIAANGVNVFPSVRNLRFVTDCECSRQVRRYTTCGDFTSEPECVAP